jgi:glycosyltransferase involved in cell wall biosynthesis
MTNIKWTKKLLDAAALEIVSRPHPIDSRTKDGIPREAILARLECEIDYTKRISKKLEDEHRAAEEQLLKLANEEQERPAENKADAPPQSDLPQTPETPYPEIPPGTIAVSVIVPVYNSAAWIRKCLNSLAKQTLKEIEILIIDDGSPDNAGKICDEYAARYKNMKIVHKENGGVGSARNAALAIAKGEYIGYCAGDDWLDHDFFQKLYARAAATGADIVKGVMWTTDGKQPPAVENAMKMKLAASPDTNNRIRENRGHFNIEEATAIVKRDLLEKNNITSPPDLSLGIAEDTYFQLRAACLANKIELVNDAFYNYFRREGSLDSAKYDEPKMKCLIRAMHYITDFINSADIDPQTYGVIFKRQIWLLLGYGINKTDDASMRAAVAQCAADLYKKCKYPDECK